MKHIKKRFYLEKTVNDLELVNHESNFLELYDAKEMDAVELRKRKGQTVFLTTTEKKAYGGFVSNIDGEHRVLLIPDPTLVYFNNAQWYYAQMKKVRNDLKDKLNYSVNIDETGINQIYTFFGVSSGFVIFLFTAIESFINQQIPEGYEHKIVGNRKTEVYNQKQIYEVLDFNTKMKVVLPEVTNLKNFFDKSSSASSLIINLKEFRDDIIHTKPDQNIRNGIHYQELIKRSLQFKYKETLAAVAKFMNHYKPNYIEECSCDQNF